VEGAVSARADLPDGILEAGELIEAMAADFGQRVTDRRIDLVKIAREGLPELEYLPGGVFLRGKRHLIAAPRKTGKSIVALAHGVEIALAGERVVIFDRENGARAYASRLKDIMAANAPSGTHRQTMRRNLAYYEFPQIRENDADELIDLADGAAVVIFDATRMFLTDLGLQEKEADDYAEFMKIAVDPLFQAGIATLILDNTGHAETGRARGSSAKGDLNEVLFTLEATKPFSRDRQGVVRLKLAAGDSRFGNEGEWDMDIGGGAFSRFRRVGQPVRENRAFRDAAVAALQAARKPLSQKELFAAIRRAGVTFGNRNGREMLYRYADDRKTPIHMSPPEGKGFAQLFFWGSGDGT
jgi:hypothetical protein